MRRRGLIWSVVGVVLMVIFLASGCAPTAPTPAEPIKIGQLCDLTGFLSVMGIDAKEGVKLRMEEAGWEVAGRPIELILDDTATDTATTLDKAKKQVERDGVDIIIGPLCSADSMALAPYCRDMEIFNMSVGNHPREISEFGRTIAPFGSLDQVSYPMGMYAYDKMGFRKVVTFAWDYVAGYQYQEGFKGGFEDSGGEVIQEQWVPMGAPDFSPFLATTKDADAAILWICDPDLTRFLGQYIEFGLLDKMPVHLAQSEIFYWETVPVFADKLIGFTGGRTYAWPLDNPLNKKFVAAFEQKYGKKPNVYHYQAYESASIVLDLFETTGGDTTPEKLREAIFGLQLETPTGPVTIGPDGIGTRNMYILELDQFDGLYDYKVVDVYPQFRLPEGYTK